MRFVNKVADKEDTCCRCGGKVHIGQRIRWAGRYQVYHLVADCAVKPAQPKLPEGAIPSPGHPGLFTLPGSGGKLFAMTRHGARCGEEHTGVRCEDSPCCGCCGGGREFFS